MSKPNAHGLGPHSRPLAEPIQPSTVYQIRSPEEARRLIAGELPGYLYSRDAHPNGDALARDCARWHRADEALVTGSGMAALAVAMLAYLQAGDRLLVSNRLYGRSLVLFEQEAARLGVACGVVDTCDLAATRAALSENAKMLVVETITNPMLRVTDVAAVAQLCHDAGAALLVDNTFASPAVCRPLELGAALVMESVTKIINGHSDVMLGMLCGDGAEPWQRMRHVASTWGFMASPFDCWLAARGLQTLSLRAEAACRGAAAVAEFLADRPEIAAVHYPGLSTHPDHPLACRQFGDRGGSIVTIELASDPAETARAATVERFILAAAEQGIPFCPSLGEIQTTLSHPASTSHRGHSAEQLEQLGIRSTTIRLSIGIEPADQLQTALSNALAGPRQ